MIAAGFRTLQRPYVLCWIGRTLTPELMLQLRRVEDPIEMMGEMDAYSGSDDELYEGAKELVIATRKASTSFLQRRFGIGYSRAARLLDLLEEGGIIGE